MEVLFFHLFVILDALTLCGCVFVLVTPLFHVLTITWRTHPRVLEYSFTVTCSDRNDGHDVQTGILKVHTTAETGLPTGASVTVLKSPTRFPRRFLWKFRKSALPRATKSTFRCRGGHPTMQCSGFDKGLQDTVVRNLISFLLKPEAESLFLDVRRILHQNNHCVLFTAGQKVLVCFRWNFMLFAGLEITNFAEPGLAESGFQLNPGRELFKCGQSPGYIDTGHYQPKNVDWQAHRPVVQAAFSTRVFVLVSEWSFSYSHFSSSGPTQQQRPAKS